MNAQSLEWNDLQLVQAIGRTGSLSGAARILGVNHSTVFRRIGAIETSLKVRLFDRHARGYSMTAAGEAFLSVSDDIENQVNELTRLVIGRDISLRGTLRVAVPDALLLSVLMRHIPDFARTFPEIELELISANTYADLTKREADIAVRATSTPSDTLFGRRLCNMATTAYAIKDEPVEEPIGLAERKWLLPDDSLGLAKSLKWHSKTCSGSKVILRSNSLLTLKEAAIAGMGAALLPCFMGDTASELIRLMAPPAELTSEIWLLTHTDLKNTARVRAFMSFISEAFKSEQACMEGSLSNM